MLHKTTLVQWLTETSRGDGSDKQLQPELIALVNDVAIACKSVASLVDRGELAGVLGSAGAQNVQGEQQKKLDVIANDVFIRSTIWTGRLAGMASEEMEHMYPIPADIPRGKYLMTFDPLDGSSNIDVNGSVGTIFSILPDPGHQDQGTAVSDNAFLQSGRQQLCAGYCLYSSATMLILTLGQGVSGFTLDKSTGDFILTHPEMKIPPQTSEYAINSSNARHWEAPVRQYIDELQAGRDGSVRDKNFNMRWAGSMVGDLHRVLCRGGIFLYPLDAKMIAGGKNGKLRLLYEANPMGLLVEQAGGMATTGTEAILDIDPVELHQRVPVIMGSSEEVERVTSYHGLVNAQG